MIPRDSQERQLLIAEQVLGLLSPEQAAEVEGGGGEQEAEGGREKYFVHGVSCMVLEVIIVQGPLSPGRSVLA